MISNDGNDGREMLGSRSTKRTDRDVLRIMPLFLNQDANDFEGWEG